MESLMMSLQQIGWPSDAAPCTLPDTHVPFYFRTRFVTSGYRPLDRSWRFYLLSVFQRHNETVNVWTHLLAFLVFLRKFAGLADTVDFVADSHSWPLLILVLSSLTYTALSVVAHLLGGKSELCHYGFYFLDYVGVAQYQYGSAVGHFYYGVDEQESRSLVRIFMPTAAILSCVSCLGCCYGKYCSHTRPRWVRKVCQVVPSALAYLWDSSPVARRLLLWSGGDSAIVYHCGQVSFFLGCALFFTFPLMERLRPQSCDFLGQSHQVFHVLLSCCTFCQIHACHLDYVDRRNVYSGVHGSHEAARFVGLYLFTLGGCGAIAAVMLQRVKHVLDLKTKSK